jgi:serine/threonine-protein phosphatase 2A activator
MSIMRIHQVKHGPFHEHSSQLHSIAVGVPNWGKVNSGLFKMYEVDLDYIISKLTLTVFQAEVLGKRVVVQHIPLGGLLEWSHSETAAGNSATSHPLPGTSSASTSSPSTLSNLQAPWATPRPSQPFSEATMPTRGVWSTQAAPPGSRTTASQRPI